MSRAPLTLICGLGLVLALPGCGSAPRRPVGASAARLAASQRELVALNQDIGLYQKRAAEDPTGGLDLAALAGLYLQRARVTGNPIDFDRAERTARQSERNQGARNGKAGYIVAASLLGQHRFAEAGRAARALCADNPGVTAFQGLLGEIQLELGDYAGADSTFASLARNLRPDAGLETIARLARWDELNGRAARAEERLREALRRAAATPNLSPEQRAWFHLRLGDFAFRQGRADVAEMEWRAGLADRPDDRRLLLGLARLAAARRRWRESLRHAEAAVALLPDPAGLVALGEARLGLADKAGAEACFRQVEAIAFESPFNRVATTLLVERGRRLPETVAWLTREAAERPDIQGQDLLAFALYRVARYAEADSAIRRAGRLGGADASFEYHAGLIARALGRADDARHHLGRALAINPLFHPTAPDSARALLKELGGVIG